MKDKFAYFDPTIINKWFSARAGADHLAQAAVATPQAYRSEVRVPQIITDILAKDVADFEAEKSRKSNSEPLTHAALILDESTSMGPHKEAALVGFNSQIKVVKEGAKLAGSTLISLNIFSSTPRQALTAVSADKLLPLTAEEYQPHGGTALFDSLGDTIALLLSQPNANDPNTAFLVAAFTDGEENSSRTYTGAMLKELITRLEATGRWTFTLMGPSGGAQELADILNLNQGNVAMFDPLNASSVQTAFSSMAEASNSYMTLRSKGITSSQMLYSSNHRD